MEVVTQKHNVNWVWQLPRVLDTDDATVTFLAWRYVPLDVASLFPIKITTATIEDSGYACGISVQCRVRFLEAARNEWKVTPLCIIVSGIKSDHFEWECRRRIEVTPLDCVADVVGLILNRCLGLEEALPSVVKGAVTAREATLSDIYESM